MNASNVLPPVRSSPAMTSVDAPLNSLRYAQGQSGPQTHLEPVYIFGAPVVES